MTQRQYPFSKTIAMNVSNNRVFIIEDTNSDGKLDTILSYAMIEETKPNSFPDDPEDYYILDLKSIGQWIPPSNKNMIPLLPIPEYEIKPFIRDLKKDARWSY